MNSLQSLKDAAQAWNPWASAEEIAPPPPIPSAESLPGVSQWIPGISVEETPAPSFLPESLARVGEKVQGLLPNVWTAPHFEAFQDFGKRVCEYLTPLVSDRAEEICADENNHTIAAAAVAALVSVVIAKTMLNAARAFSCRNKDLSQCILAGSLNGVKKRLQKADIDSTSLRGETVLILASRLGQEAIVRHLIKFADPNIQAAGRTGDTALHAAIRAGENRVIPLLLGKADINKRNANGQTPIILAVAMGNDFAIDALAKEGGIDWRAQDVEGNTALHYSTGKNFKRVILDKSDANIRNKRGRLPLHVACASNNIGSMNISAIAAETTDPYAEDRDGKIPFVRALETGSIYGAISLFDQRKVVTVANSDIVGLALKKGMSPRDLFGTIDLTILQKIKPEGLDLPTFAAIYGVESGLKNLASRKLFFQGATNAWRDNSEKLVRSLLEKPHFLARITTRKYDKDALLRELDTTDTSASAAAHEPSMELALLVKDAQHYLDQLEREHCYLAKAKR